MRRNVPFCLNLRETAIHEQFRSADVATVVGREKDDGLGNLFRLSQRKYFLNGKKEAFDIDVEDRVIKLLRYLAQRGIFRNTGIREDDVESALLALDLRSEPIQIVEIRDISRNGRYIFPDFLRGL